MNILIASSEAVPFSKTGGLADVTGALPAEIGKLGHHCTLIVPAHRSSWDSGQTIEPVDIDLVIPIGQKMVTGELWRSTVPGTDLPVYLVGQKGYYDRDGLYQVDGVDYVDNCERFVFFSRAVLEVIRLLELPIDLIHVNDWQTGLVPAYLKTEYQGIPRYERIASLLTIHNLAYQGRFWHWDMLLTGLDWKYFNWEQMEFHGDLSLLKTGIVFADAINTVSPRYAQEIQYPPLGEGLDATLQHRRAVLSGILNGINMNEWCPSIDPHIAANYTVHDVFEKKPVCKAALQREMGLPERADVPLVGVVTRLCEQKGVDLITKVMSDWAATRDVQWVILGSGSIDYETRLYDLAERSPENVAVRIGFSVELSHRIEAGADMFLMPSRFEPCGLNQMYSLNYGTVPVVRATGGLADTVVNATDEAIFAGTANGIVFQDYSDFALSETLRWACEIYRERREVWNQMIATGMRQDWSWARSAKEYIALYEKTIDRVRNV
ncbi:MAG: glycogen synthase GlgA [Planctomycetia bacterium]|jgi:starch synthase